MGWQWVVPYTTTYTINWATDGGASQFKPIFDGSRGGNGGSFVRQVITLNAGMIVYGRNQVPPAGGGAVYYIEYNGENICQPNVIGTIQNMGGTGSLSGAGGGGASASGSGSNAAGDTGGSGSGGKGGDKSSSDQSKIYPTGNGGGGTYVVGSKATNSSGGDGYFSISYDEQPRRFFLID